MSGVVAEAAMGSRWRPKVSKEGPSIGALLESHPAMAGFASSIEHFSGSFIFLVSNIDSVTFQNMGHLRKQYFKRVLMTRTESDSLISGRQGLRGRMGCSLVPRGNTALLKIRHTGQVLGPGIAGNMAIFISGAISLNTFLPFHGHPALLSLVTSSGLVIIHNEDPEHAPCPTTCPGSAFFGPLHSHHGSLISKTVPWYSG